MSINTQILIGVPVTLLDAVSATGPSGLFALPARSVVISWQASYNTAPSGVDITLRVSNDEVNWAILDETTNTSGELRVVSTPVAALFIDCNFITNTGGVNATVILVAKVAEA